MTHEIINLTSLVVVQEIENVLCDDYPEKPYQAAFDIPELRQKLIAHVLTHTPNNYTVIEKSQQPAKISNFLYPNLGERLRINVLIRGSILHILRENADWVSRHIRQQENLVNQPSH